MNTVVHGLDELAAGLRAQLDQLHGREVKRAMRVACYAGAAFLRDEARRLAPVDASASPTHPKRLLRKSIRAGSDRALGDVLARAGVYVKPAAFYWRFLEYGTVHMAAKPFLRPAFDNNEDRLGQVVADRLSAAIDQALARR